jgi:hypothetical protein
VHKPLIFQIFDEKKAKLLSELYQDDISESAKLSIKQFIGQELGNSDKIIIGNELNQLILLTSQANFISCDEEPVAVGVMMFYCMKQTDVLPKVTEQRGKSLAAKCLISLSLFKPALERLSVRYGAPSPSFYKDVGIATMKEQGYPSIATNFERWNSFLHERFI